MRAQTGNLSPEPRMKTLILGPTFTIDAAEPPDHIAERLGAWVTSDACPFAGERSGRHLQLAIKRPERHRWSPWLTVEVRPHDDEPGCDVFGRFNPSPGIWTGYMLGSLALFTIAFVALMWGCAELVMRKTPIALWVIPACFLVLVVMWLISAAGQKLATDEMTRMHQAVEAVVRPRE